MTFPWCLLLWAGIMLQQHNAPWSDTAEISDSGPCPLYGMEFATTLEGPRPHDAAAFHVRSTVMRSVLLAISIVLATGTCQIQAQTPFSVYGTSHWSFRPSLYRSTFPGNFRVQDPWRYALPSSLNYRSIGSGPVTWGTPTHPLYERAVQRSAGLDAARYLYSENSTPYLPPPTSASSGPATSNVTSGFNPYTQRAIDAYNRSLRKRP